MADGDTAEHLLFAVTCRFYVITFPTRRSRGDMYIGHGRLCVCVCVCVSVLRPIPTLLKGLGCNLGEW